jgi:Nuclease-related domain
MAGRHHDEGRVCLCDLPDGTCAGLVVRRMSQDRVWELAEEIWTASSGDVLPPRPVLDPRSSQPGASAQAAYRRQRERERASWRFSRGWWTCAAVGVAAVGGLIGASVGAWLGWPVTLLLAAWSGWRLRFRPSPGVRVWRQQAAMQRRTAEVLRGLGEEGHLVLHDVVLPGWLDSLDHLVVGPTGVWVVESWQRRRLLPAGRPPLTALRGLRCQADAVAQTLEGWARVPVRPLLCLHSPWWSAPPRTSDGLRVAALGQLPGIVRSGPGAPPEDLQQAIGRLLEVLRPAA